MVARDRTIRAAARNNAEWCDSLCRTHGIPGTFDADAWVNPSRTPRYYPDAVTLDRAAVAESILGRIDTTSPGCSVKDSFASLDLGAFAFRIVHEAEWLYREPALRPITAPGDMTWQAVKSTEALAGWEAAWDADGDSDQLFRPELLRDPAVRILGGYIDGAIVAGAIANRTGSDLVGLSNVFATDGNLDRAWTGCLAYVDAALPGLAVVGYEAGRALAVARGQGFESVGHLRIWLKDA